MRKVLDKDKGNERTKYTTVNNKNEEKKMFDGLETALGKSKDWK